MLNFFIKEKSLHSVEKNHNDNNISILQYFMRCKSV